MGESVKHLDCSLGVAYVVDFWCSSQFFNSLDVGHVVIETHISPGPIPVVGVVLRAEGLVIPRVLCTTVVADPDIIALLSEQQMERNAIPELIEPESPIL